MVQLPALRPPIIGVVGGGEKTVPAGSDAFRMAEQLGAEIAKAGAILLCGGGTGIMSAVAAGANGRAGRTLGVLPSRGQPLALVAEFAATGMGDGRNYVNVFLSDVLIAMKGESGTLSEIALAHKVGRPIVYLGYWSFLNEHEGLPGAPYLESPKTAVATALALVDRSRLARPLEPPVITDQTAELSKLVRKVAEWSSGTS
jgi:uncharacterized protein (TIGR00725 family)